MHVTPFGRINSKFEMLSGLGRVQERPKKALPQAPPSPERKLRAGGEGQESESKPTEPLAIPGSAEPTRPEAPAARAPARGGEHVGTAPQDPGTKAGQAPVPQTGETTPQTSSGKPTGAPVPAALGAPAGPLGPAAPPPSVAPSSGIALAGQAIPAQARPTAGIPPSPTIGRAEGKSPHRAPERVSRPNYAPRSEKMVELAREQRDSVFRSIALALTEKGGKAHFQLDPRELGSVGIELEMHGKELRLKVRVEREEIASVMREDLPKLQSQLENRGLTVQSIDVQTSSRQEQERDALRFRSENRRSRANPAGSTPGTGDATETAASGLLGRGLGLRVGTGIDFLA